MANDHRVLEAATRLFGPIASADGEKTEAIATVEARLGFRLPEALRSYYLTIGKNRRLNGTFHRLRVPDRLEIVEDALVFFVEQQGVLLWGIPISSIDESDPTVVQAFREAPLTWQFDSESLTDFLLMMVYWQAALGATGNFAVMHDVQQESLERIKVLWPRVELGRTVWPFEIYSRGSEVLFLERGHKVKLIAAGCNWEDVEDIGNLIEADWNYEACRDDGDGSMQCE